MHRRGQYLEGGTCKCFLSVERALHSVFLFTPVLHVLVIQIFRNLQVIKRQQVEEFVRRLIFPISQAAVAASEQSSSYINYCSKFYLRGSLGDCSIQVNDNTNWDSVKSDRNRLSEADITVIDGKQIREFNRPLNTG